MKNIIKILGIIGVTLLQIPFTFSAEIGVSNIEVITPTTIEVEFSENPKLKVGELDAEVKILKDISLRGSFMQDSNSVEILLEDALLPNTAYSLLTIIGADGSIDFTSPETIEGSIIENINSDEDEDIESIEIVDSRNIIVTYKQSLGNQDFEFKLLAESKIEKIDNEDFEDKKIAITVAPPFTSEKDYILMFIELQDIDGNYVEFDTGIYDFTTPVIEELGNPAGETITEPNDENNNQDVSEDEDDLLDVVQIDRNLLNENESSEGVNEAAIDESIGDLNAAGDETGLQKSVNDVAQNALETPDTGAETWVLILLSLFINTIYYLSRKKKPQLA